MVKAWLLIPANLQKWGIPESVSQNLGTLAASAKSALDAAKNESTRTPAQATVETYFTRWKKDLVQFDYGDSGKTARFAVVIENGGKQGSWGP
jgi:hypothetical protein